MDKTRRERGALLVLALLALLCAPASSASSALYYNSAPWISSQKKCGKAAPGGRLATVGGEEALASIAATLAARNWTRAAGASSNHSSVGGCQRGLWLGYFNPKGGSPSSCGTPNLAAFRPVDGTSLPPLSKMCVLGDSCGSCIALYSCSDRLCLRRMPCTTRLPYLCVWQGEVQQEGVRNVRRGCGCAAIALCCAALIRSPHTPCCSSFERNS